MCTDARVDSRCFLPTLPTLDFEARCLLLNLELTIHLDRLALWLWNLELCLPHAGITGRWLFPTACDWMPGIPALVLMLVQQEFARSITSPAGTGFVFLGTYLRKAF